MSVPNWRVRDGTLDDLKTLAEGNHRMAIETEDLHLDRPTLEQGVASVLRAEQAAAYFIAVTEGGDTAGQLMVTREWSDWRNAEIWWIQSVYVWPEHRKRGVYRALATHVEAQARAAGARGLRLYVDLDNAPAQEVYRRMGMNGDHYRLFEQLFT